MKLTQEQRSVIKQIRKEMHKDYGYKRVCDSVSWAIQQKLGFQMRIGMCWKDPNLYFHAWNVLPNGDILDATLDQFEGETRGFRVIKTASLEFAEYSETKDESLKDYIIRHQMTGEINAGNH